MFPAATRRRKASNPANIRWFEDPGYPGTSTVFDLFRVDIASVPANGQGIVVKSGLGRAPEAKFAYVTPAWQAPFGPHHVDPQTYRTSELGVRKRRLSFGR